MFTSSLLHTRSTRRNALVALGLVAVSLVSGCGGGSDNNDDDDLSPFRGGYSGAFTSTSGQQVQQGTTTLSVEEDGTVTGTVSNTTINAQGPVSGSIENSGDADITFTYTGLGSARLQGRIRYNASDERLTGTLTQTANGSTVGTVEVFLQKIP